MQPQRIPPRLLLPPNRLRQILIMLIHLIRRVRRVREVLRRLEQSAHQGIDDAADGGGDGFEAFALWVVVRGLGVVWFLGRGWVGVGGGGFKGWMFAEG